MITLMDKDNFLGPVNVGNDGEYTIKELAEIIIELTGSSSKIVHKPLPSDDPCKRRPDLTLARKELNYEPIVPVREGLQKTIDYFKSIV